MRGRKKWRKRRGTYNTINDVMLELENIVVDDQEQDQEY